MSTVSGMSRGTDVWILLLLLPAIDVEKLVIAMDMRLPILREGRLMLLTDVRSH